MKLNVLKMYRNKTNPKNVVISGKELSAHMVV